MGDWIVVEGAALGVPTRCGQVVEVRHADGSPPYLVHWLDTGGTTLVFPGPDARVVTAADEAQDLRHRSEVPIRTAVGTGPRGRSSVWTPQK